MLNIINLGIPKNKQSLDIKNKSKNSLTEQKQYIIKSIIHQINWTIFNFNSKNRCKISTRLKKSSWKNNDFKKL